MGFSGGHIKRVADAHLGQVDAVQTLREFANHTYAQGHAVLPTRRVGSDGFPQRLETQRQVLT